MGSGHTAKRPTFFWQGLMIVLPVVALASVGALSVRQDKALARSEASERAQAIADELLPKLWQELAIPKMPAAVEHDAFKVGTAGELVFPPPYDPVPRPVTLDVATLSTDQLNSWLAAQATDIDHGDLAAGTKAYREFLSSKPPTNFAAAASYSLGRLLDKQGRAAEAAEAYYSVVARYPNAVGETGLPLAPLAQWRLVQLDAVAPSPADGQASVDLRSLGIKRNSADFTTNYQATAALLSVETFCSNLVHQPTSLSSFLLRQLHPGSASASSMVSDRLIPHGQIVRKWQALWEDQEQSRQLFAAFGAHQPKIHLATETPGPGRVSDGGASDVQMASDREASASNSGPNLLWFNIDPETLRATTNLATGLPTHGTRTAGPEPGENRWLAARVTDSTNGQWVVCHPESEVRESIRRIVEVTRPIPDYLEIGVEVCGRKITRPSPEIQQWWNGTVTWSGRVSDNFIRKDDLPDLASLSIGADRVAATAPSRFVSHPDDTSRALASATHAEPGAELLRVNAFLTNPNSLYRRQRIRAQWFAALIAAAAASAGIGLLAAYRAFHRQILLSDMKTNFVSSVSHELRAPIAAVRLLAESLERGRIAEEPKRHEYFRFIVQECRRLSGLIENVLDFSRIEQGRKQYDFEPTDLAALVQQTVKLMEPYAAERRVELRLDLSELRAPGDQCQLSADGKALQQALVNLIDNAIKHSPSGGTVNVGLEPGTRVPSVSDRAGEGRTGGDKRDPFLTENGSNVLLWVEDHGEGIPAEEHEKIFERFYRRGSELRRETQGVGIGLSLVKHIVEAHQGRVTVRSAPGQGSRFTIALPYGTNPDR